MMRTLPILITLTLLSALLVMVASAHDLPATGTYSSDLIIDQDDTIEGVDIVMDGDIYVESGATLVINNSIIQFGSDAPRSINVEEGSNLVMASSQLLVNGTYPLTIRINGSITASDSEFIGLGPQGMDLYGGIVIDGGTGMISDCVFSDSTDAISVINGGELVMDGGLFDTVVFPINGLRGEITISNVVMDVISIGPYIIDSNLTLTDSTISFGSQAIKAISSGLIMENVSIGNTNQGVFTSSCDDISITGCSFLNMGSDVAQLVNTTGIVYGCTVKSSPDGFMTYGGRMSYSNNDMSGITRVVSDGGCSSTVTWGAAFAFMGPTSDLDHTVYGNIMDNCSIGVMISNSSALVRDNTISNLSLTTYDSGGCNPSADTGSCSDLSCSDETEFLTPEGMPHVEHLQPVIRFPKGVGIVAFAGEDNVISENHITGAPIAGIFLSQCSAEVYNTTVSESLMGLLTLGCSPDVDVTFSENDLDKVRFDDLELHILDANGELMDSSIEIKDSSGNTVLTQSKATGDHDIYLPSGLIGSTTQEYEVEVFKNDKLIFTYELTLSGPAAHDINTGFAFSDLKVAMPDLDGGKSAGKTLKVTTTITNQGDGDSPATKVELMVVTADDATHQRVVDTVDVPALTSGQQHEVTLEWTPDTEGDYTLYVRVDPSGNVEEEDEGNNLQFQSHSVKEASSGNDSSMNFSIAVAALILLVCGAIIGSIYLILRNL